MPNFETDQWVASFSPIAPEKLHALGAITLYWNNCEIGLFVLFSFVSGMRWSQAWAVGTELREVSTAKSILALSDASANDEAVKQMVRDTIKLYGVNRVNRNHLIHFTTSGDVNDLQFMKASGPAYSLRPIPSSVEDIRRVAENLKTLSDHLEAVADFFLSRVTTASGARHLPLPQTPSVPELLLKTPRSSPP